MAPLDWTVSPRFELGYRLPSALGEVDVGYRFLLAQGAGTTPAGSSASPDATVALTSHLNMDVGDLDYASRETSLGPYWGMKWRIGLRIADLSFDSRADEPWPRPRPAAEFSSGALQRLFGARPPRRLWNCGAQWNPWGLGWVGRLDSGLLFGQVQQKFVRVSTNGASSEIDFDE